MRRIQPFDVHFAQLRPGAGQQAGTRILKGHPLDPAAQVDLLELAVAENHVAHYRAGKVQPAEFAVLEHHAIQFGLGEVC
ncbi:hypothetical protein AARI_17990 [Glutamicibacter arilaitensis Re117]|uniref:Uncharacterized protein n=1 Tax=Glutamicibacter arilaitensis (strain DSM 16368 / CIP 108037 / IAM 15318 / JCM 13566 / NCIMB 14258 / Re117) TaxID=861360 RepID=A0ABM9PXF3_GLUAR|nr:hypothetical protein AARI_17990 [Glutamicibacter arilaitensis Re117]